MLVSFRFTFFYFISSHLPRRACHKMSRKLVERGGGRTCKMEERWTVNEHRMGVFFPFFFLWENFKTMTAGEREANPPYCSPSCAVLYHHMSMLNVERYSRSWRENSSTLIDAFYCCSVCLHSSVHKKKLSSCQRERKKKWNLGDGGGAEIIVKVYCC